MSTSACSGFVLGIGMGECDGGAYGPRVSLISCEHSGSFRELNFAAIGGLGAAEKTRLGEVYTAGLGRGLKDMLLEAGRALLDERAEDSDAYGFLEIQVLRCPVGSTGKVSTERKSNIQSLEDLRAIVEAIDLSVRSTVP